MFFWSCTYQVTIVLPVRAESIHNSNASTQLLKKQYWFQGIFLSLPHTHLCLALTLSICGFLLIAVMWCVCRSFLARWHHTVYFVKGAEESSSYNPSFQAKFLLFSFFSVSSLQLQWGFFLEKCKTSIHLNFSSPFIFHWTFFFFFFVSSLLLFSHLCVVRSKQHTSHHHSPKTGSTPPSENYVDYMIVEPPQSPLRMQTASMDPYTYHQVHIHTNYRSKAGVYKSNPRQECG